LLAGTTTAGAAAAAAAAALLVVSGVVRCASARVGLGLACTTAAAAAGCGKPVTLQPLPKADLGCAFYPATH